MPISNGLNLVVLKCFDFVSPRKPLRNGFKPNDHDCFFQKGGFPYKNASIFWPLEDCEGRKGSLVRVSRHSGDSAPLQEFAICAVQILSMDPMIYPP